MTGGKYISEWSVERIHVTAEEVATRIIDPKGVTSDFPRATRSEVESAKPLVASRTKAGGASGRAIKAAVASDAESIENEDHTPVQSTRKDFIRRGATIEIYGNVKGPSIDRDSSTQRKPCVTFGPPDGGS